MREQPLPAAAIYEHVKVTLPTALVAAAHESASNGALPTLSEHDLLIVPDALHDVALLLRDDLGYRLLSDLAVVDYIAAGVFELVYLFFHPAGGEAVRVKVRVPRDAPRVPSLTPIWQGANLVEREGYDLFGVEFVGHPYLQRIYMWDEFEGHPMRKDFPRQGDKYIGEDER